MENCGGTVSGWINPLLMTSLTNDPVNQFSCEDIVRDIFAYGDTYIQNPVDEMKRNYAEISSGDFRMFCVPSEKTIMNKIVGPLYTAKKCYCLSDYIGCISMCGMVCEMVIIFIYDLISINCEAEFLESIIDNFGKYERWGQEKRIKNLKRITTSSHYYKDECVNNLKPFAGLLCESIFNNANTVKNIRREYLHFLSKDYSNLKSDAQNVYKSTHELVSDVVAFQPGEGGVIVPRHLEKHIEKDRIQ